jgi:guanylate kinase
MNNKEHVLICLMGKTASGKDTLANELCERTGMRQIISYTTRERRTNEGNTHIFISDAEYQALESSNQIAAFTQIGPYKYCCTVDQLYENDIYVIDPVGVQHLRELNLPNLRLVTVYVNTPDEVRKERALKKRGDDRLVYMKRDLAERDQFRTMLKNSEFDYAISNIDVAKAYSVLRWISTVEGAWHNGNKETAYNVEDSN